MLIFFSVHFLWLRTVCYLSVCSARSIQFLFEFCVCVCASAAYCLFVVRLVTHSFILLCCWFLYFFYTICTIAETNDSITMHVVCDHVFFGFFSFIFLFHIRNIKIRKFYSINNNLSHSISFFVVASNISVACNFCNVSIYLILCLSLSWLRHWHKKNHAFISVCNDFSRNIPCL